MKSQFFHTQYFLQIFLEPQKQPQNFLGGVPSNCMHPPQQKNSEILIRILTKVSLCSCVDFFSLTIFFFTSGECICSLIASVGILSCV